MTVVSGTAPVLSSGTRVALPAWSSLVAWTHSWDCAEAVLYTPGGTEQTDYGVNSSSRVASIADRGSGNKPLLRDTGSFSTPFSLPSLLPGPLWVPSDPDLYRQRPAVQFDIMPNYSGATKFWSMLSPNTDTYFNTPNGYDAPYWMAILGDGEDSALGEIGAGPTFMKGSLLGGNDWTVGCYDFGGTITLLRSSHDFDTTESVLLLYYNSGGGGAATDCFFEVNYRKANGALNPVRTYGGQEDWPFKELFYGWVDPHGYWSAAAIKLGTPTTAQLDAVRSWATYLPVTGSRA